MRRTFVIASLLMLTGPSAGESSARGAPETHGGHITSHVVSSLASSAIERGLAYLEKNRQDVSALLVLDYLQRKYHLPQRFDFAHMGPGSLAPRWHLWGRLVGLGADPDGAELAAVPPSPAIDRVVLRALYCDRVALPPAYADDVERLFDRGGYERTHTSLAVKVLADNGCALASRGPEDLREKVRRGLVTLVEESAADARYEELDMRYEALAFLLDFHREKNVGERLLARLLAEQQSDGGWRPQPDRPTYAHTTTLAVWVLLARRDPDAPDVPFARR